MLLWRVPPPFREREREREIVIFCVDLAAAVYGKWQIGSTEIESVERKVSTTTTLSMDSQLGAKTSNSLLFVFRVSWDFYMLVMLRSVGVAD